VVLLGLSKVQVSVKLDWLDLKSVAVVELHDFTARVIDDIIVVFGLLEVRSTGLLHSCLLRRLFGGLRGLVPGRILGVVARVRENLDGLVGFRRGDDLGLVHLARLLI